MDQNQDTLNSQEYGIQLAPTDSFKFFTIALDLTFEPDSFMLVFASSDLEGSSQGQIGIGSVLWLDQLMIDGVNSLNFGPEALQTSLFPNPANHSATLTFTSTPGKKYQLRMYDMQGRIVQNNTFQAYEENSTFTMTTSRFPDGLYIVAIHDTSGNILASKRLQIQQ